MVYRCLLLALFGVTLTSVTPEWANAQTVVAFPRVTGPKPAGRGPTAQGVIAAFEDARLEVLRGPPLRAAAEELGVSVYSLEVAQIADCDYLVIVRLSGKSGSYKAKGQIFRVTDGESVLVLEQSYRNKRGATAAGRSIGTQMAEAILRDSQFAGTEDVAQDEFADDGLPEPPPPVEDNFADPETPVDTFEDDAESDAFAAQEDRMTSDPEPSDPVQSGAREPITSRFEPKNMSPEQSMIRLGLNAGTRVGSSYTINSNGAESNLSYSLDPLFALNAHAALLLPFGLGADIDFVFAPATFAIGADVQNQNPTAQYLDVVGNLSWKFDVANFGMGGKFSLLPIVGIDYSAAIIENQGVRSVVNAYSTMSIVGGLRVALDLPPRWGVDLEGKGGLVVDYQENPAFSGVFDSGVKISTRGRVRFWVIERLAAQLSVSYEQRTLTLAGPGDANRVLNVGDPALQNAEISIQGADITLGAMLAF